MTSGTPPSPRDSHTCSSWKNNVIVIGGEDGHDYYLSDVHVLDTGLIIFITPKFKCHCYLKIITSLKLGCA